MTFNARNQGRLVLLVIQIIWFLSGDGLMEDIIQWNYFSTVTALMPIFGVEKLPAGHLVEHGIIIGRILEIE